MPTNGAWTRARTPEKGIECTNNRIVLRIKLILISCEDYLTLVIAIDFYVVKVLLVIKICLLATYIAGRWHRRIPRKAAASY